MVLRAQGSTMRQIPLRKSSLGLVLAGLVAAVTINYAAPPGEPLQGEIRANATTAGFQGNAAIARDADGDYVIVWSGAGTGDADGIFMQRYNRNGAAQGGETRVNTTVADNQRLPSVAMDAAGNFVIAWESNLQDGDGFGLYAQRYSAAGSPQGSEFRVNGYTASDQTQSTVAMSASGAFVIAWRSLLQDGSGQGIYAQLYDAAGTAVGGEFRVNTFTTNSQSAPSATMQPNGDFLIAWETNGQEGSGLGQAVYMQRYSASGVTLGAETRVNTTVAGNQSQPAAAIDGSGGFVVGWQGPDASGLGVYLQRYDASGIAVGDETPVSTTTAGDQTEISLGLDASGDLTAVWTGADADGTGVYLQRFDANSLPQGTETAVNGTTTDLQRKPAVAVDADGDIVVAWESNLQDGASYSTILRRYAGPETVDLSITQTDSPDPQQVSGAIAYTLTVRNNHLTSTATGVAALDSVVGSATGIVVTDTLPAGTTFNSSSGSGWTCANVTGALTCNYANALLASTSSSVTINVSAGLQAATLTNSATIAANQHDPVADNDATSEATAVCGLGAANPGTLQFSAASFAGSEASGLATVTVSRTGGSCGSVGANYQTGDGSAKDGDPNTEARDYTATTGSLAWAGGDAQSKTFTVPVTDDALNEASETINLTLSLPADAERGALGTQRNATIAIADNDALPGVTLGLTGAPIAETGGVATLTATLSEVSGQDVTANLAFGGNATLSDDYTRSATSIVIPAGELSASMTVAAVDDLRDEIDETVVVDIATVTNGSETGTQQATVSISDDDAEPAVQFSAATSMLAESAGSHSVIVQLSAVSGRDISVDFALTGLATTGSDYTIDTSSAPGLQGSPAIIPANGAGTATITVTVTDDALDEAVEDVVLTLTAASNATLGETTQRTVSISDNDATPTVVFTTASQTVAETNAGVTDVTMTAHLSAISGQTVTVPYGIGGTARNPQDHDAVVDSLVFPAGTQDVSYVFHVANDTLDDADTETVVVTLEAPTNATLGSTSTHTVSITDNDAAPSVSFGAASQSVAEDVAGGTASIAVQLSGASGRDVTVPLALSGTASNGSDYTVTGTPVLIPQGSTQAVVTVSISNDPATENDETAVATLSAPADGSATIGVIGQHTLTIVDNDVVPQLGFATATQSVIENVMLGTATVTLQLSRASSDDVTLPYSIAMISSANPEDYRIVSDNPLIIPAGSTSAYIVVEIADDASDEADQTLVFVMGTPENATAQAPTSHTLTILDNDDAPLLKFVPETQEVAEGGLVTVIVAPDVPSEKAISVAYTVDGTASGGGTDHDAQGGSFNLPAGAESASYSFNVAADALDEPNETIVFALAEATNAVAGGPQTVTILDDDQTPEVSLSATAASLAENGGTVELTAQLSSLSASDVVVGLGFGGGATGDVDYSGAVTEILIPAGSSSASITLSSLDDSLDEADEAILVAVTEVANAAETTPQLVAVTITDDDASPNVSLALSGDPVAENGGVATVTATLSAVSGRNVVVRLGFIGPAVSGSDYTRSATSIVIPAGASSGAITLTGINDTLDENDKALSVYVSSLVNGVEATEQQVTTTIVDDDPPPSVDLSISAASMAEAGGSVTVTATLSAVSARQVVVNLVFGSGAGMAIKGTDYSASAVQVTIPPGATSRSITLTASQDSLDETNEAATVNLGVIGNGVRGTVPKVSAAITDDDNPPAVTLSLSDSPLAEDGGVATVTATLDAVSGRAVTINLAYSGAASSGVDYSRSAASITIAAGATSGTVTLTGLDDTAVEGSEDLIVDVASAVNAAEATPQQVTATISDND